VSLAKPKHRGKVTLRIELHGRLDIRYTRKLFRALTTETKSIAGYIIDLRAVREVYDSGVALLLMANRLARAASLPLKLVNCDPGLARRCRSLGLTVAHKPPDLGVA
jgi:anti-anti-sigma regulatory factor